MEFTSCRDQSASPALSYISMSSVQYGFGEQNEQTDCKSNKVVAPSPAPTCSSAFSNISCTALDTFEPAQSVKPEDRHESFSCFLNSQDFKRIMPRKRLFSTRKITNEETVSRSPSPRTFDNSVARAKTRPQAMPSPCLSYQSDQSMGTPIVFRPQAMSSPCLSCQSYQRTPIMFRFPVMPSPCLSYQSDQSIGTSFMCRPEGMPSPCLSYQSDQSMGTPIVFNNQNVSRYLSGLVCTVCTNSLKDPEFLQCGHSFCKDCVLSSTITIDSCPQCGKRAKTQNCAGPEDVVCDICTEITVKAVKSCLTCSASYCERHIRSHYTVPALQRHVTIDAKKNLKTNISPKHLRAQERIYPTGHTILCEVENNGGIKENPIFQNLVDEKNRMEIKLHDALRAKEQDLKKTEMELALFTNKLFPGFGDVSANVPALTSDLVEVAALGRKVKLGMLYDCCTDSFSPDGCLWDDDTISSRTLSIPRLQSEPKILKGDSLNDRLQALDLSNSLKASVLSDMIKLEGAAEFLNHSTKIQDQVTLHFRSSTKLVFLSQTLLNQRPPFLDRSLSTATHVVIAVLCGAEAFFVFENNSETPAERNELIDAVHKIIETSNLNKKQEKMLNDCVVYMDGEDLREGVNYEMTVKLFRSFQKPSGSRSMRDLPIKFWLYPLKNLDKAAGGVAKEIDNEQLVKAEKVLEGMRTEARFCQLLMSAVSSPVFELIPEINYALLEFFSHLKQYQSVFKKTFACFIKSTRQGETEEQWSFQHFLNRLNQSPFSLQNLHQWLQNREAELKALNKLTSFNIPIFKSQNDLQRALQNTQATRMLCFTLTSLQSENSYLQALKQHIDAADAMITDSLFRVPDTSQKILSDLEMFLLKKDKVKKSQEFTFMAIYTPDSHPSGSCINLYQAGGHLIHTVNLNQKPEPLEILKVQETRVTLKQNQNWEKFRVEYRAEGESSGDFNCKVVNSNENWVISGLSPKTKYQLRYAGIDSNGITDYSAITEFCTFLRAKPGPPTVLKLNSESYIMSWQKAEPDEDSPVIRYLVEYMEAGLDGWQSFQTEGSECEITNNFPHSTVYKARVSAMYANGDFSPPSDETKVPVRVWSIDLLQRKASILLEVLKHQSGKKSIKLKDCTEEENEEICFLQCLPYISQLRFDPPCGQTESTREWAKKIKLFMLNLCLQAALHEQDMMEEIVQKLPISCFKKKEEEVQFLLELYLHVKEYEIQSGTAILQKLQPIYQAVPQLWSINLSKVKASLFLEVLKLQTKKKPVELTGWEMEPIEMESLLCCLPYISELRFVTHPNQGVRTFLLELCLQAALHQPEFLHSAVEKLALPRFKTDKGKSQFVLDLFLRVKDYEDQKGQSVVQQIQPLYLFFPEIWSINFSETNISRFLEVLKLQKLKKPLELRGWKGDDEEVKSLLLCLPYISELRFNYVAFGKRRKSDILQFLLKLVVKATEADAETQQNFTKQLASVCSFRTFSSNEDKDYDGYCNFLLDLYSCVKEYETATGRDIFPAFEEIYQSVGPVWAMNLADKKASLILDLLKRQAKKTPLKLTGWFNGKRKMRSFFQCLSHISQLRLCSDVVHKIASAKALRTRASVTIEEVSLVQSCLHQADVMTSDILHSMVSLLKIFSVKCLDLTEYKVNAELLIVLSTLQSLPYIRLSSDSLQDLTDRVNDGQNEELTCVFLKIVGGDLSSCLLDWEKIKYFLQYHSIIVDFRKSRVKQEHIRDLVPVLHRVQFKRLTSSVLLSIIREMYETSCAQSLSSLLNAVENCIHLNNLTLDTVHCAALHFTLQHCTAVSLCLKETFIPDGELEKMLPFLRHVSNLSVDRLLLLRLLRCCIGPEHQSETEVLLSVLQHKLDFSCQSTMDLTTDSQTQALVLNAEDCRAITSAIQRASTHIQLILHDCEIEEGAVELFFPVLHQVTLCCSKALLLQFLDLVHAGPQEQTMRRAEALSQALKTVDLSHTHVNQVACTSMALVLDKSEGLSDLDLSHCHLSDDELKLLLPQLHKVRCIDISHNDITDLSAEKLYEACMNSNIHHVCLFNNRIKDKTLFLADTRFEIW